MALIDMFVKRKIAEIVHFITCSPNELETCTHIHMRRLSFAYILDAFTTQRNDLHVITLCLTLSENAQKTHDGQTTLNFRPYIALDAILNEYNPILLYERIHNLEHHQISTTRGQKEFHHISSINQIYNHTPALCMLLENDKNRKHNTVF